MPTASLSAADQDRYFVEMGRVALALGADPIPRSRSEAQDLITAMRPHLVRDARTREVARLVLGQRGAEQAGGAAAGADDASGCRSVAGMGATDARVAGAGAQPPAGSGRHPRDRQDPALGVQMRCRFDRGGH